MAKIMELGCVDERGRPVPCDASGKNVAFSCPRCAHPMLATAGRNQRGSSPEKPALCRKCRFACWVEVDHDGFHRYSLNP